MPKQNEQDILNEARSILADLRPALNRPLPHFYLEKVISSIECLQSKLAILEPQNCMPANGDALAKRLDTLSELRSCINEARRLPPEVLPPRPERTRSRSKKIEKTISPQIKPQPEQQPTNGADSSQNQYSSPSIEKQPLKVFYSFVEAKRDKRLLEKLEAHLAMLKEQGIITSFNRGKLVAGTNKADAIKKNWEEAAVILLLISPDYLATGYDEMQRAMDRHKDNTTIVIPILLRPADIKNTPVGRLIRLPSNGKPVTKWANSDEAFEDIAQGIREAITQKFQRDSAANASEKMRPGRLSKGASESDQIDPVVPPVQHQRTIPNSSPSRQTQAGFSLAGGDSLSTVRDSQRRAGASNAGFPHGYALIIGIARYSDERLRLPEAVVKDVMDMHTILRAKDYCGYASRHVQLRYDVEATADTIRADLKWLAEMTAADKQATAIFYFSGHGERIVIDEEVTHYLFPYNCNLDNMNDAVITGTELIGLSARSF